MDAIETTQPEYEDDADPTVKTGWEIDTLQSADWAFQRLSECEGEADEIEAQFNAYVSRARARADMLKAKAARGAGFFRFKLLVWAEHSRSTLLLGNKKTREFLHGKVSWRTKPERLEVTDKAALVEWLSAQPIESGLYRVKVEPEIKALQEQFKTSGEIPPGMDLAPASESIHVEATPPDSALSKE